MFSRGFEGHTKLFDPRPLNVQDPHPAGRCPDPNFYLCAPFSCHSNLKNPVADVKGLHTIPLWSVFSPKSLTSASASLSNSPQHWELNPAACSRLLEETSSLTTG